jgi:hypothetical protein
MVTRLHNPHPHRSRESRGAPARLQLVNPDLYKPSE